MFYHLTTLATHQIPLRDQLNAWFVPRKRQHEMRIAKAIQVNGKYRNFNELLMPGDQLRLSFAADHVPDYTLEGAPLDIVYEDEQVLVVNKPAGIKTHPNQPLETGTLMNWVAAYLAPMPAFITHRLDQATSGLILIAKDPLSQAILNRQLSIKMMTRRYVAIVSCGIEARGMITAPIGADPNDKRKRMIRPDGDPATTKYMRTGIDGDGARICLELTSGRTHQIRVHLASIGFPIIGDPLYGQTKSNTQPRMLLHATQLRFMRPLHDQWLTLQSPAPF